MHIISKKPTMKIMSLIVTLAIMISSLFGFFPSLTAEAAHNEGDSVEIFHKHFLNGWGQYLGFPAIHGSGGGGYPYMAIKLDGEWVPAFCIDINAGTIDGISDSVVKKTSLNSTQKKKIEGILQQVATKGFTLDSLDKNGRTSNEESAYRVAAQIAIWGIVYGETLNTTYLNRYHVNNSPYYFMNEGVWALIEGYWDEIVEASKGNTTTTPKLSAPSKLTEENGWKTSVTDSNKVLSGGNWDVKGDSGLTVKVSSNKITISASGYFEGKKKVTLTPKVSTSISLVEVQPKDFPQTAIAGAKGTKEPIYIEVSCDETEEVDLTAYFDVKFTKKDSGKDHTHSNPVDGWDGTAQGDANLKGAVYGLYKNGTLVDTYTTNASGSFWTDEFEVEEGASWYIQEISPSEGYLLDTTKYYNDDDGVAIGSKKGEEIYEEIDEDEVEDGEEPPEPKLIGYETYSHYFASRTYSKEDPVYGKFRIYKIFSDGNSTTMGDDGSINSVPEVGAEFEVYLTSAGSYENAKEYERDILVIDEYGTAVTKMLPYGMYTLHQTKAWENSVRIDDITNIWVGFKNGKTEDDTYDVLFLHNKLFRARIRLVKVDGDVPDGEDPKVIPIAGVGFQLFDPEGNLVTMDVTYPNVETLDTFYTNELGEFVTPFMLDYGRGYYFLEVAGTAPYGYALRDEPFYVDVVEENADEPVNAVDPVTITVEVPNIPQKGVIQVDKYGEIFASVVTDEKEEFYQPQYREQHLEGATFEIYAAEDIYTPDGTLRCSEGELVDTITTNGDGVAYSKPLYLGSYNVIETQAPAGYVLDDTPQLVTIVYNENEEEIIYDNFVTQTNDRQTLALSIQKVLEQNELFGVGMNDEILNISFGLYAGEDIVANDGTFIPTDGLIEIQSCDKDGLIVFTTDLPFGKYYVQELSTDNHYILNGEKFEFTFEYMGQDTAIVEIKISSKPAEPDEPIDPEAPVEPAEPDEDVEEEDPIFENFLKYGLIGGIKIDGDSKEPLSGAVIGLFAKGTTEFNTSTAIMTTKTDAEGKFAFKNIPYGDYIVKELVAPTDYNLNNSSFAASIKEDGDEVEITIPDERSDKPKPSPTPKRPSIRTTATSYGKHEEFNKGIVTIKDEVEYYNLTVGKEYTVYGTLMDKSTGEALLINGKKVTAEKTFTAKSSYGTVTVSFTFDASGLKDQTSVVVFERLEHDGIEVATHANIYDEDQTITFIEPSIGTTVDFNSEMMEELQMMVLDDVVYYHNLILGREYVVRGVLIDKNGNPYIDCSGNEVRGETAFVPTSPDGEVVVRFILDASDIQTEDEFLIETFAVVFEEMYFKDTLIAEHKDMEDEDQTVELYQFPEPEIPRYPFPETGVPVKVWGAILAASAVITAALVIYQKKKW